MRKLVSTLTLFTLISSVAFAQTQKVSNNETFINKFAIMLLLKEDQAAFDALQTVAANRGWARDKFAAGELRSTYENSDAVKKGIGLIGWGIGLKAPLLGSAVEKSVDAYELYDNLNSKYFAPTHNILARADLKQVLRNSFAQAEKNGSLDFILKNLSQRFKTNLQKGEFPPDTELAAKAPQITKILDLAMSSANNQAKQAELIKAIANTSEETLKKIVGLMPTPEATALRLAQEKIEEKHQQRQMQINTTSAQLSLASSLASVFKIQGLEKPLTVGRLWVDMSTHANNWTTSLELAAGNSSKMANANWIMAANTATACIMAYQMLAGGQSGEAAVMKALKQIGEQLKMMDRKLDYLIEMSENNFTRIIGMMSEQSLVLDVILQKTNKSLELQYQNQLAPFIQTTKQTSSKYSNWITYCKDKGSKFCKPREFYDTIYTDLVSRQSVDSRQIDGYEDNLAFLTMPLNYDETKSYRQYQSTPYLIQNLRSALQQRLREGTLAQNKQQVYGEILKYLHTGDASNPADTPNAKIWRDASVVIRNLQLQTGVKPKANVLNQIFEDGKKLVNYESKFLRRPLMHYGMMFELQEEANSLVKQANAVHNELAKAYVTEFTSDGTVKRAASNKYVAQGILPSCWAGEANWNHADVDPKDTEAFFGADSRSEGFGYFRMLEVLGYGTISKCIYWSSRTRAHPNTLKHYGIPLLFSIVPIHVKYTFRWNPKAANDALTRDEKDVQLLRVDSISPAHESWRDNRFRERNDFYKKGTVTGLSKEQIAKYERLVRRILDEEIAGELATSENFQGSIRVAKKGGDQLSIFQSNQELVEALRSTFNSYRSRFYLYNAFVQQSVLAGTSSLKCQAALAPPKSISSRDESGYPRNMNIHPRAIIDGIQAGIFRTSGFNAISFIDANLRSEGRFHCQATRLSPYLVTGFDNLAKTMAKK